MKSKLLDLGEAVVNTDGIEMVQKTDERYSIRRWYLLRADYYYWRGLFICYGKKAPGGIKDMTIYFWTKKQRNRAYEKLVRVLMREELLIDAALESIEATEQKVEE